MGDWNFWIQSKITKDYCKIKQENGDIRQQNFTKIMIWIIISNVTESQVISETNSMKKHSIIGANFMKKSESQR